MPKGVEHEFQRVGIRLPLAPRNSVMPKGVEHTALGILLQYQNARETL